MGTGTDGQSPELSNERADAEDSLSNHEMRDLLYVATHSSHGLSVNASLFDRLLDLPSASEFIASSAAKLLPGIFEAAPDTHDASKLDQHLQSLLVQKAPKMEQLRPLFLARRAQYRSIGLYQRALQFTSALLDGFSNCIPVAASHSPQSQSIPTRQHRISYSAAAAAREVEVECSRYSQQHRTHSEAAESSSQLTLWMNDPDAALPLHWRQLPHLQLFSFPVAISQQPRSHANSNATRAIQVHPSGEMRANELSRSRASGAVGKPRAPRAARFRFCGAQPHALRTRLYSLLYSKLDLFPRSCRSRGAARVSSSHL